jgi:orotidine-5'-phosphate decarboxylase
MAPRSVNQTSHARVRPRGSEKTSHPRARRRLIFALDVASLKEVDHYVALLADEVGLFKVGKQLFVHAGPEVVRRIHAKGGTVFLDLKFHDIPQTVASASVEAARLGVKMFTLHASGGVDMLRQAQRAVRTVCRAERLTRPTLLAVTVLTSLGRDDLKRVGVRAGPATQVVRLAQLAQQAGIDGLVASPREIAAIRRACGDKLTLVIPGVRPQGSTADDQKRILTPHQAMQAGANYLVVGRPIRDATDPRQAVRDIVADMARGLRKQPQVGTTRSRQ